MHSSKTTFTEGSDEEGLDRLVEQLELLQGRQFSPQQPSAEVDRLISRVIRKRPEWRARLAVKTSSTILRQKILNVLPEGGRALGSEMYGKSHIWREKEIATGRMNRSFSGYADHNWPKVERDGILPEKGPLPAPIEKVRIDPVRTHSMRYSFPRATRFAPGAETKVSEPGAEKLNGTNPGPGTYLTSDTPTTVPFVVQRGEQVVYGANHIFPYKGMLGNGPINPVNLDCMVMASGPKFTFARQRRETSEPAVGRMRHHGDVPRPADAGVRAFKTDCGNLSPGPVYEHYSTFHPQTLVVDPRRKIRIERMDKLGASGGNTGGLHRSKTMQKMLRLTQ